MRPKALLPIFCAALALLAAACGGGEGAPASFERSESTADAAPITDKDGGVVGYDAAAPEPASAPAQGGTATAVESGAPPNAAAAPAQEPAGAQPGAQAGAPAAAPTSMIIREGTAQLEVKEVEPAIERVRQMAERLGGYVGNTALEAGAQQARRATMELKLPAQRFDEALRGLRPIGTVEQVNVTAQDVGEEFVDVSARMENARRMEARLVELLASRTGSLSDVLTVERELARVREEIERYQGRLRYLRTRVSVSTLTVTLHEPYSVGDYVGPNPIVQAFRQAWENFISFVAWLIATLGWLIPLLAVLAALWWLYRRLFPRGLPPRHDRARPETPPSGGAAPPPSGGAPGV